MKNAPHAAKALAAIGLATWFGGVSALADASSSPYRFAAPPLIAISRDDASGDAAFDLYVRLNRPLPRSANGKIAATLTVGDVGGDAYTSTFRARPRRCYTEPIDQSWTASRVLAHPRAGAAISVRLYVNGKRVATATGHLTRTTSERLIARRLGC